MKALIERAPERMLRSAILTALVLAASIPLLILSPRVAWWQDAWLGLLLCLGAGLNCLYGELHPELADGWLAERVRRYAPGAVGLVIASGLLFPTLGTWPILWLFFFVDVLLLAFAFVARVRVVCLSVSSALGLGMLVVDDGAVWCLPVLGLAWLLVPALDRYARTRMRLYRPPPPTLPSLAAACAVFFATGGLVFAAASWAFPPSVRDYEVLDLLEPRGSLTAGGGQSLPDLPGWELFVLLAAAGVALYLSSALSEREEGELEEDEGLGVRGSAPAALRHLGRALSAWPPGPRKRLVETYLEHVRRLEGHGVPCPPERTPREHSARVGGPLGAAPQRAAARLASLFERARWAPAEVSEAEASDAAADARVVEDALFPPRGS